MTGAVKVPFPQSIDLTTAPVPNTDGADIWLAGLRMVRRRLWLIAVLMAATCILALPVILSIPKLYHAEIRLMIRASPALALPLEDARRNAQPVLEAEIERMLSDKVIEQVIADLRIASQPEFAPKQSSAGLSSWLQDRLGGLGFIPVPEAADPQASDTKREQLLKQVFRDQLKVSRQGSGNVLTIGFTSRDPQLALSVPTAMANIYHAQSQARWQDEVSQAGAWMREAIDRERARVAENRALFEDFMAASGLGVTAGEAEVEKRLSLIKARQSEIEQERFQTQAEIHSVAAALKDHRVSAIEEPESLQRLRLDLAQERRERMRLGETYGDRSAQVTERVQRIAAIEAVIGEELRARSEILYQQARTQASQAAELAKEAAAARRELEDTRVAAPVAQTLKGTLERQEQSLSQLEDRYQALLAQARIAPVVLDVLLPSTLLKGTVGPSRKMLMAATALGSLLIGLFVAAVIEMRDTTVRGHDHLMDAPHLVPVGLWPRMTSAQRKALPASLALDTASPAVDAIRDTILMIECTNGGCFPRLLTVTEPDSGDLSEPVAEWLALELVARGRRVRLVDARGASIRGAETDSSRPLLVLGPLSNGTLERVKLTEILPREEGNRAALLRELVKPSQREDVLTIIDAPPILSGNGLRLMRDGGTVLLVLRWGKTRREAAELAAALLARIGILRLHTLITDVDRRRHRHYGFQDRLSLSRTTPT